MKDLLEKDFVAFHNVNSVVTCDITLCSDKKFDLDDDINYVKPYQQGKVSFVNESQTSKEIIPYEKFIDACEKPSSFKQGRKKCDFLVNGVTPKSCFVFVELTSTLNNVTNLSEPIIEKKKNGTIKVLYPKGKYEKCEDQLYQSLLDIVSVPSIKTYINTKSQKVCLMAYKIILRPDLAEGIKRPQPNALYRLIESKETGENGAELENLKINNLGFEYRRISHDYAFNLIG